MRKGEMIRYLLMFLLMYSFVHAQDYAFSRITTVQFTDYQAIAAPSNPPSGFVRWYQNSTTNLLTCLRNDGSDCTPLAPVTGSLLQTSTSCPIGYTEYTAADGVMSLGTLAAHANVGTTGGANNITPTGSNGTVSFTPTGTESAAVFTGSSATTSAVSAGTPAGTNGTVTGPAQVISWPVGVPTNSAISMSGSTAAEAAHTHSVTAAGTNGAVTGPAQVISWPAGVPAFTGTAFTSVINHVHVITVTDSHLHTENAQGGTTAATTGTHVMTSVATGGSLRSTEVTSSNSVAATATEANPAGGVASITPAGTIAWPAGVPTNATSTIPAETFTGSAVTSGAGSSHLHAFGTLAASTPTVSWPVGVPTNATSTIPAETFTGSALGTHTHTLTATGTNAAATFTGNAGTVPAETWTGNSFDNRSAFIRVIYCIKS